MYLARVVKDGGVDSDIFGTIMSKMLLPQSYKSPVWCWRKMEKIKWTDLVRNEEILQRVKVDRGTLHTVNRRKSNWISGILRRYCFLKRVIEGKIEEGIEVTGR